MSRITRSDRRTIIGIARLSSWVSCMESMEVEVMASSLVAQATKPGFAHTAVDPCFLFKHVFEDVDKILVSVI
jgi:hypothetical protein